MQPPDELMTSVFLPAMRQLVAIRLRNSGLSQNRISSMLGVTQASVSIYLSTDATRAYSSLSKFSISRDQANRDATLLAEDVSRTAAHGVRTLDRIWKGLLGEGLVCPAHRELYPSLADCDFCLKEYGPREGPRSAALLGVAEAVRLLEASPTFVNVMPEVSVNIACAVGDATRQSDVIAIPGRVVKVKNRARATAPPEAGASIHMSKVLLLARKARPDIRACINLRHDERMSKILKGLGLRTLTVESHDLEDSADSTAAAMSRALKRSKRPFDVIVDLGGRGIEPNVYLFSKGPREVAELALGVANQYSAR